MLFKKNHSMEFIETDESGLVVFNPASGDSCILDDIGYAILHAMGDGATLDAITDKLSQEYMASPGEIRRDVDEFLGKLVAQGILVTCE
ncbi:MAG: HPr-rel-A system PqqD family peptide chaperone [Lachnospiraceae bacterium]|jgi:PqqD family protein of HPr-rel-A system|nr:HPr-rel-A system PqqD family peptide chaperone [Lachnospiraceae bacterium]